MKRLSKGVIDGKTELKLPKGLSLRGNNSIQAKASVTIDGVERRPTKAFKFVDVKKSSN